MEMSELLDGMVAKMQSDSELAWSWHCAAAMSFYDELPESILPRERHAISNKAASRFMKMAFHVETEQEPKRDLTGSDVPDKLDALDEQNHPN